MLSGGGVAFAHNADGAFQYLKRTCNGTTPDDILRKMADEMVGMIDWLTELAKVSGTEPTKTCNIHSAAAYQPYPEPVIATIGFDNNALGAEPVEASPPPPLAAPPPSQSPDALPALPAAPPQPPPAPNP